MRTPVGDVQEGFAGGLNTIADASQLAPNEIRVAENCRLTIYGAVQKRSGTRRTHVTALGAPSPIRGGFSWRLPGSTTELAMSNGALNVGTYAIPMVWTAKVGAFDGAAYPSFAPFRDGTQEVCYIADGGPLNKYDGTNVTVNLAGTPSVARIAVQNGRLFGISGTDQTLYYSALNNGDTLATGAVDTGSAVIRTFGSQELRGLLALGESLVLFHREGISRFTGYTSDDISLATGTRGISSDTGTIAPDSIVAVENTGYFLTDRGFYMVTEAGVAPISTKIEDVIAGLDQTNFNRVKAVHHRAYREVWWYLPDIGCYVYNYRLNAWTGPMTGIFTSAQVNSLWSTIDAQGKPIVLMGDAHGFVRRVDDQNTGDDILSDGSGGSLVAMNVQLRRMYCGTPEEEKVFRRAVVQANTQNSGNFSLFWQGDGGISGAQGFPVLAGKTTEVQIDGRGNFIDFTINDIAGNLTGPPDVSRVSVAAISYGRRYGAI